MQKLKLFSTLFISLFLFNLCQGQEEYVIRITATNCSYLDGTPGTTNTLTGFVLNGKGVMTALHGVCGCRTIAAEDANGKDLGNLEIVQADLGNDVALLTSERIRSEYQYNGLEYSTLNPNSLSDQPVIMIGFGYGVARPKRTTSCKVRKPATIQLINGIMPKQKVGLSNRNSPDIYNDILDVDMAIPPGCSGAPIIYNGKVVGIADGGLEGGSTNYCWAIPVNKIQLSPKRSLEPAYSELAQKNPENIFVLTSNLDDDPFKSYMKKVSSGRFNMGSNEGPENETPIHEVYVSGFNIGIYEVTQEQWESIMNDNPAEHRGCAKCPIENVSWTEVQEFLRKLNKKYPNKDYRLPTEAEWEYAARGGRMSNFLYSGSNNLDDVAWYNGNSSNVSHPVGKKMANALGLYDMSGNVYELCSDYFNSKFYSNSPTNNPKCSIPHPTNERVVRGGDWYNRPDLARVARRGSWGPEYERSDHIGFRLVRSAN